MLKCLLNVGPSSAGVPLTDREKESEKEKGYTGWLLCSLVMQGQLCNSSTASHPTAHCSFEEGGGGVGPGSVNCSG